MEKVIEIPSQVRDLAGLYFDLRKAEFAVRNVGAGPEKTYVYLDDAEEKDPSALVLEWSGKEMPSPKEMVARAARWKVELAAEEARKEAARKAAELAAESDAAASGDGATPDEPESPSRWGRFWKKLW
jgi:hypothetical protein